MKRVMIPDDDLDRLIDEKEAARLTGFAVETFQAWRIRGSGPRFIKFGHGRTGRVRYRYRELMQWIDQHPSCRTTSEKTPMPLKIQYARWAYLEQDGSEMSVRARFGYPILIVEFEDGRVARIDTEAKLLRAGIVGVYLTGDDFSDCELTFPHPDSGEPEKMQCATDHDVIVGLTLGFLRACERHYFRPRELKV